MSSFYDRHKDSTRFDYRCFDRILLNGLIQAFQQPERVVGFFNVYRQLYPVSRDLLRGIAEQFQQLANAGRRSKVSRFWKRRKAVATSSWTRTSNERSPTKWSSSSKHVNRRAS